MMLIKRITITIITIIILISCSNPKTITLNKEELSSFQLNLLTEEKTFFEYGSDDYYALLILRLDYENDAISNSNVSIFVNNISTYELTFKMRHANNKSLFQALSYVTRNDDLDSLFERLGYNDRKTTDINNFINKKIEEDIPNPLSKRKIRGYRIDINQKDVAIKELYSVDEFEINYDEELYYYEFHQE